MMKVMRVGRQTASRNPSRSRWNRMARLIDLKGTVL
jgi:hypothetical protein